mmetsp:Transcript_4905/g.13784  ORF Transcript_4905/g.13784 Transcript_4905/m.13784 type:complete len:204 (+) Transcript_4905:243-854(+)
MRESYRARLWPADVHGSERSRGGPPGGDRVPSHGSGGAGGAALGGAAGRPVFPPLHRGPRVAGGAPADGVRPCGDAARGGGGGDPRRAQAAPPGGGRRDEGGGGAGPPKGRHGHRPGRRGALRVAVRGGARRGEVHPEVRARGLGEGPRPCRGAGREGRARARGDEAPQVLRVDRPDRAPGAADGLDRPRERAAGGGDQGQPG